MKLSHLFWIAAYLLGTTPAWAGKATATKNKPAPPTRETHWEANLGYFNCGDNCTEGSADWGGGLSLGLGYATFTGKNHLEQSTRLKYVPNLSFSTVDTSLGAPLYLTGDMSRWEFQYDLLYHPKNAQDMNGVYFGAGLGYASNKKSASASVLGQTFSGDATENKYTVPVIVGHRWISGVKLEMELGLTPGFSWSTGLGYSF